MNKSDFLSIVDIVGQYVQLTPEGPSHYVGRCPFCSPEEDSLILSVDTQYWHCLVCGADGDRYDFVSRSENISRAQAILMVGHHTSTGEPFPHARFKPGEPPPKVAETRAPAPAAAVAPAKPAEPAMAKAASPPVAPPDSAKQGLSALRNLIPSYQGAALLDEQARMIFCDTEYPYSAELAGIGEILAPIFEQAGVVYSQSNTTLPGTLTLAAEDLAIVVHKFGSTGKVRLFVVRLGNPSDVAVARRLMVSASAKFT